MCLAYIKGIISVLKEGMNVFCWIMLQHITLYQEYPSTIPLSLMGQLPQEKQKTDEQWIVTHCCLNWREQFVNQHSC